MNMENNNLFEFAAFDELESEHIAAPRYSYWKSVWRTFIKNKFTVAVAVFLIFIISFALIQPTRSGYSPIITPNINVDRTVTLRLMQETSARKEKGGTIVASVVDQETQTAAVQEFKVDTVEAKSIAGTFVAQNEMAVVAGGMVEETVNDSVSGIPVLMDIPWLGWFFRSTTKAKTRSELVIYMKPHVISTPGESRRVTEAVTADKVRSPNADRYRSAANRKQERRDREEAKRKQKEVEVLPDVDAFHIK